MSTTQSHCEGDTDEDSQAREQRIRAVIDDIQVFYRAAFGHDVVDLIPQVVTPGADSCEVDHNQHRSEGYSNVQFIVSVSKWRE